ncbi:hypothetical protein LJR034_006169 [Caballeronia sp. LjRoot34]|uniref:hypothetical protein n=1 Tax=Caballeronia sp. LjRoot34 TaxID=3342325 RepID=UPI003ECE186C
MIEGGVHTGGVLCGFRHGGQDFSFAAEVRHLDFAAGIILRPLARVNPRGKGTGAAESLKRQHNRTHSRL